MRSSGFFNFHVLCFACFFAVFWKTVEMTPLNLAMWHFMMCLDTPVPGMLPQLDER